MSFHCEILRKVSKNAFLNADFCRQKSESIENRLENDRYLDEKRPLYGVSIPLKNVHSLIPSFFAK